MKLTREILVQIFKKSEEKNQLMRKSNFNIKILFFAKKGKINNEILNANIPLTRFLFIFNVLSIYKKPKHFLF